MTKFIVRPSTDKHVLLAAIIEHLQTEKYEDFDKTLYIYHLRFLMA